MVAQLAVLACAAWGLLQTAAAQYPGPVSGQALFYGASSPDTPTNGLVSGSCGYGLLDQSQWPSWDVTAIGPGSVIASGTEPNMGCGVCIQVTCTDSGCATQGSQVILQVVDTCLTCTPTQLNLPYLTFQQHLAEPTNNLMVSWQQVDCNPPGDLAIKVVDSRADQGGFLQLVVQMAAGSNKFAGIGIRTAGGSSFTPLTNAFGAAWQGSNFGSPPFDVQITSSTGATYIASSVIPAFSNGQYFSNVQIAGSSPLTSSSPPAAPPQLPPPSPATLPTSPGPSPVLAPVSAPPPPSPALPPPAPPPVQPPRAAPVPPALMPSYHLPTTPAPRPAPQSPAPVPVPAARVPSPVHASASAPRPHPAPAPAHISAPVPVPAPAPVPQPSAHIAVPAPVPVPVPVPEPSAHVAVPVPVPQPLLRPAPAPAPVPSKVPRPAPVPAPVPVPAPAPSGAVQRGPRLAPQSAPQPAAAGAASTATAPGGVTLNLNLSAPAPPGVDNIVMPSVSVAGRRLLRWLLR